MIENVIIGSPLVHLQEYFAFNEEDWINSEQDKTYTTQERFLPKIMVECGIVKSASEVRRNQPKLCISFDKPDFVEVKWGKKFLWIMIGE